MSNRRRAAERPASPSCSGPRRGQSQDAERDRSRVASAPLAYRLRPWFDQADPRSESTDGAPVIGAETDSPSIPAISTMGERTGQDVDANSALHPHEGGDVAEFDSFASNYEETLAKGLRFSGEQSEYFARGRVNALAAHLASRPTMTGAGVILDFGCGTGSTTPLLKDLPSVARVIGTDVSQRLLDTARAEHAGDGVEFVTKDQIPERVADVAYCNGVFHHIPPNARDEAIAQVRSALRPGGVFALCENNPWNPGTRLVMRSIPFDRDADPLSARQARRLLIANGFDIEATEFLFFFPRTLSLLRRWEGHLRGLPLGAQYVVFARSPS